MQPQPESPSPADLAPAIQQPPASAPAPIPAPADATRGPRITVADLAALPDSDRRNNWISALVDAEVARQNYAQDRALARDFAISGQFDDIKGSSMEQAVATAMVKIQLGRGWGFNPADSMRQIYFANGRPSVENDIVASKLQQGGFDWDVEWLEDEIDHKGRKVKKCVGCRLWLKKWNSSAKCYQAMLDRNGDAISVSFTQYDADTAQIWEKGKQIPLSSKWNFQSWGRDMYYWRAISRVKKYHAPHILRGGVSRDEALEMIPVEGAPPDSVPADLQREDVDFIDLDAVPKGPSLRDKIMSQPSFLEPPPTDPK
jgi:hypothetical protein